MATREVLVVECDGCGKTMEVSADAENLWGRWRKIEVADITPGGRDSEHRFDVCSSGCAEKTASGAARGLYS